MRIALDLAIQGEGFVEPNPMVGCVLVHGGQVVGRGYHQRFGGPHAEIVAIESATDRRAISGATAYVTLEPCCHFGKTPPCADALIDAGVARVVVAVQDPFAEVDGGGIAKLRAAGIDVTVGVCSEAAERLIAPFAKRVRTDRPWVIAKWAMTIDGRIATASGQSQWITGESSRREVHRLRGRVDAIVAGMGTVQADNPMLNARPPGPRSATRVVMCRRRLPSIESKLVQSAGEIPLLLIVGPDVDPDQLCRLVDAGAQVLDAVDRDSDGSACPDTPSFDATSMVDRLLAKLAAQGATNVMLEGGGEIFSSFFAASQVDQCHVFIGPKAFGGKAAPGPIGGDGVESLAQASQWTLEQMDPFDGDVRLIYRRLLR